MVSRHSAPDESKSFLPRFKGHSLVLGYSIQCGCLTLISPSQSSPEQCSRQIYRGGSYKPDSLSLEYCSLRDVLMLYQPRLSIWCFLRLLPPPHGAEVRRITRIHCTVSRRARWGPEQSHQTQPMAWKVKYPNIQWLAGLVMFFNICLEKSCRTNGGVPNAFTNMFLTQQNYVV